MKIKVKETEWSSEEETYLSNLIEGDGSYYGNDLEVLKMDKENMLNYLSRLTELFIKKGLIGVEDFPFIFGKADAEYTIIKK